MFKRVFFPFMLTALFALPLPAAQAAGCVLFGIEFGGSAYANFPSSNVLQGGFPLYGDSNCQTEVGNKNYQGGVIHTSSPDTAMSTCRRINDAPISRVTPVDSKTVGSIFQCILGDPDETVESQTYEYFVTFVFLDSPSSVAQGRAACIRDHPPSNTARRYFESPTTFSCYYIGTLQSMRRLGLDLNAIGSARGRSGVAPPQLPLTGLRITAFDGMDSGIQFRRLTNYGVGDPAVFEMGYLDAVDIWSNVGSGYEVCFPQVGRIVFLDAATAPRTLLYPDYRFDDGWACATMDRAGTMVLVEAPPETKTETQTTTATATRRAGTDDSVADAIALNGCWVTPRVNLRLRRAPWGGILHVIPRGTEVAAAARTPSWFNLSYGGAVGWSAAWLVDSEGECDYSDA